jgi:hypothetical protein
MFERQLSTGCLKVTSSRPTSWSADQLFDIAERRNPKRSFLFVSKVLGRHIPVPPHKMRSVFHELSAKIPADLPGPVLFVGMAETAVGLAAGVHQEYRNIRTDTVLLTSTRHPVEGELLCEFKEAHSHATDHLIYWPQDNQIRQSVASAQSIVLIDDEATTGNTFTNLLNGLYDSGLNSFKQVCTVTLTDWSDNSLSTRFDLPITYIALMHGKWHWAPDPEAIPPVMPNVNVTAKGSSPIIGIQDWGRLGATDPNHTFGDSITTKAGERILVLGSSEFVWHPFLLAERLENEGAIVAFGSITRSPIALGHAIQTIHAFNDNYGLGIPNFVYNVVPANYDRILICCETPEASLDPYIVRTLNAEVVSYE